MCVLGDMVIGSILRKDKLGGISPGAGNSFQLVTQLHKGLWGKGMVACRPPSFTAVFSAFQCRLKTSESSRIFQDFSICLGFLSHWAVWTDESFFRVQTTIIFLPIHSPPKLWALLVNSLIYTPYVLIFWRTLPITYTTARMYHICPCVSHYKMKLGVSEVSMTGSHTLGNIKLLNSHRMPLLL